LFINQYAINVRSRLINIHIELTIISQAQKCKEKAQNVFKNLLLSPESWQNSLLLPSYLTTI